MRIRTNPHESRITRILARFTRICKNIADKITEFTRESKCDLCYESHKSYKAIYARIRTLHLRESTLDSRDSRKSPYKSHESKNPTQIPNDSPFLDLVAIIPRLSN